MTVGSASPFIVLRQGEITPQLEHIENKNRTDYVHYPWEMFSAEVQDAIRGFTSNSYIQRGLMKEGDILPETDFTERIFYVSTRKRNKGIEVLGVAGIKIVSSLDQLPMLLTFNEILRPQIVQLLTLSTVPDYSQVVEVGKFAVTDDLSIEERWSIFNKGIQGIVDYVIYNMGGRITLCADTLGLPVLGSTGVFVEDKSQGFVRRIAKRIEKKNISVNYATLSLGIKGVSNKGELQWGLFGYDSSPISQVLSPDENSIYARGVIDSWNQCFRTRLCDRDEKYRVITFHKIEAK